MSIGTSGGDAGGWRLLRFFFFTLREPEAALTIVAFGCAVGAATIIWLHPSCFRMFCIGPRPVWDGCVDRVSRCRHYHASMSFDTSKKDHQKNKA